MHPFISATAELTSYGLLLTALAPFGPPVVAIGAGLLVLAFVAPRLLDQFVIPLVAMCSSGGLGKRALALRALSVGAEPPPITKKRGKKAK
ncbi:hypothetical protein C5C56_15540 [Rathayibacter sp. AY1D1]|uniref:hypothetical protein n=1 Tax=Rathayibacter sp. AY1D1 TaxID=2080542 RepID=UPI000CE753F5|nr:hypothetical protein [Rathayibacter sp. AY1D1]PPH96042.1 hypothetical protein C5C56_15540 [Rathayibacter sp. AY1D1]